VFPLFSLFWMLLAAHFPVLFVVIKRFGSINDRNCILDWPDGIFERKLWRRGTAAIMRERLTSTLQPSQPVSITNSGSDLQPICETK
jgi:hypothetical protein